MKTGICSLIIWVSLFINAQNSINPLGVYDAGIQAQTEGRICDFCYFYTTTTAQPDNFIKLSRYWKEMSSHQKQSCGEINTIPNLNEKYAKLGFHPLQGKADEYGYIEYLNLHVQWQFQGSKSTILEPWDKTYPAVVINQGVEFFYHPKKHLNVVKIKLARDRFYAYIIANDTSRSFPSYFWGEWNLFDYGLEIITSTLEKGSQKQVKIPFLDMACYSQNNWNTRLKLTLAHGKEKYINQSRKLHRIQIDCNGENKAVATPKSKTLEMKGSILIILTEQLKHNSEVIHGIYYAEQDGFSTPLDENSWDRSNKQRELNQKKTLAENPWNISVGISNVLETKLLQELFKNNPAKNFPKQRLDKDPVISYRKVKVDNQLVGYELDLNPSIKNGILFFLNGDCLVDQNFKLILSYPTIKYFDQGTFYEIQEDAWITSQRNHQTKQWTFFLQNTPICSPEGWLRMQIIKFLKSGQWDSNNLNMPDAYSKFVYNKRIPLSFPNSAEKQEIQYINLKTFEIKKQ